MSMKNYNDTFGNRTRDLPACIAVPQPSAPPRGPRPSLYPSVWNHSGHTGKILMIFDILEFFLKSVEKNRDPLKPDMNNGYFT